MRSYVDSDVLIWHLRGQVKAANFLAGLSGSGADLWIGAVQRAEIVFFLRPGEAEPTMQLLTRFKTAPIDAEIVDAAGALYRQWNPSHGIEVNDALLAATVMKSGGRIFTLNLKHYPTPDLLVSRAW